MLLGRLRIGPPGARPPNRLPRQAESSLKRILTPALALGAVALLLWQPSVDAAPVAQFQVHGQRTEGVTKTTNPGTYAVVNQPPQCCIGPTCTHTGLVMLKKCEGLTTTFTLDASLSYDPEGMPLTYTWTGCPGTVFADPTAAVTAVSLDTSADCSQVCGVRLKVSDGELNDFCRVFIEVIEPVAICGSTPASIEWTYLGSDCSASNYAQDPAGVYCAGDPGAADPVRIVMTHSTQPSRVYFDGIVTFGETFVELGIAGHKNGKVPPTTRVQIFDLAGNLLQQSQFHTSCSQSLEVGDQFGAVIITGFSP